MLWSESCINGARIWQQLIHRRAYTHQTQSEPMIFKPVLLSYRNTIFIPIVTHAPVVALNSPPQGRWLTITSDFTRKWLFLYQKCMEAMFYWCGITVALKITEFLWWFVPEATFIRFTVDLLEVGFCAHHNVLTSCLAHAQCCYLKWIWYMYIEFHLLNFHYIFKALGV